MLISGTRHNSDNQTDFSMSRKRLTAAKIGKMTKTTLAVAQKAKSGESISGIMADKGKETAISSIKVMR